MAAILFEIFAKRRKSLDINVKKRPHGCANSFGVVGIYGRGDDGDIFVIKCCGATYDCAKVAGI